MYREGTTPQRFRLSVCTIESITKYIQAPFGRVCNRALAIYLVKLQREQEHPRFLYRQLWTRFNDSKRPVSVRVREDIVRYLDLNQFNKTTVLSEALTIYLNYCLGPNSGAELHQIRHSVRGRILTTEFDVARFLWPELFKNH